MWHRADTAQGSFVYLQPSGMVPARHRKGTKIGSLEAYEYFLITIAIGNGTYAFGTQLLEGRSRRDGKITLSISQEHKA